MRLPFSLFVALRYLKPKRTFQSIVTVLSILGVTLGVAVLLVVISVMTGFDDTWREKILGFTAHIRVSGYGALPEDEVWLERLSHADGVTAAAPFVEGAIFATHGDAQYTPVLRGVDPEREARLSQVPGAIRAGRFSVQDNEVVLGADLARRLAARVGDTLLAYAPQSFTKSDEIRAPTELVVAGIYEVGKWDLDMNFMVCSLDTARDVFALRRGWHGVNVLTRNPDEAAAIARRLEQDGLVGGATEAQPWMDLHRELFGALRAEKNMMYFLLIFITVVAAFSITNTLITTAVQKTREIGLLKALGFPRRSIMGVFIWQGWIAGVLGTLAGLGLGLVALHYRNDLLNYLNRRGMQLLPEQLYELSELPSRTTGADVAVICVAVLVICTLAGLAPAWRAARLDPAKALRYE